MFQILKIFIEQQFKTYMLNATCLFKNLNPEKFVTTGTFSRCEFAALVWLSLEVIWN